jgi:hypothetical protein
VFAPAPILLYIYGRKLRRLTQTGREADDLGHMIVRMKMAQMAAAAQQQEKKEGPKSIDEQEEEEVARSIVGMDEELALDTMVELVRTETRRTIERERTHELERQMSRGQSLKQVTSRSSTVGEKK